MHDSARASDLAIQSSDDGSASRAVMTDAADRALHANLAQFTGGLSPAALAGAYWDWAVHLAVSPGKQMQLAEKACAQGGAAWRICRARRLLMARVRRGASSRCRRTSGFRAGMADVSL